MDPAAEDFWRRHPIPQPLQRLRAEADKVAKLIAHNAQTLGAYEVILSSYRDLLLAEKGRKLVENELTDNKEVFHEAIARNVLIRTGQGEEGLTASGYWIFLAQQCRSFLRHFDVDGVLDYRVCRKLWAYRHTIEPIIKDPTNLALLGSGRKRSDLNEIVILAVSWSARLFFFIEIALLRALAFVAGCSRIAVDDQPPTASNGSREIAKFLASPESFLPARVLEGEGASFRALLRVAQHYGTILGFEQDGNPEMQLRVGSDTSSTASHPFRRPVRSRSTSSSHFSPPRVVSAPNSRPATVIFHSQGGESAESIPPQSFRARTRSRIARVLCSDRRS